MVDSMTKQVRVNDGTEISYALGLMIGSYRGMRQIAHSGSTAVCSTA